MCGIVGILHADGRPVDRDLLVRMRDCLAHRGPDDQGLFVDGGVGLGHRRLSIVDLSDAGHQPMSNRDGTVWIVFNGEIFNYVELAEELRRRGQKFRSRSDTEVLLHLYEQEGEGCLRRLNGMFGFAIWDSRSRCLFAARDRLGIKPFYYYASRDRLLFASELKAILEDESVPRRPDRHALADYLFAGMAHGSRTVIEGIRQLAPGEALTWRDGRLETRSWWDLSFNYDRRRSEEAWVREVAELLDDAVRIHCRSDAPLGCHLSGGLDSSTVASLAARYVNPLKTFSIRFDGRGEYYDETPHAKAVASHVGATYIEELVRARELEELLPSLIWHMDGPLQNPGGFSYFTVSRLASRHVKVSLTGHGGDELFAGYPAQFQAAFGSTDMFDLSGRAAQLPGVGRRLRAVWRREGMAGLARRLAGRLERSVPTFEDLWASLHCAAPPDRNPLLHPDFVRSLDGYSPREEYLRPLSGAPTEERLDQCLYHDLRSYLPGLLHLEDRVSMAVSLESRVPLLDYRLVELLATVPPEVKVRGGVPKHLLREAARALLPESVRERRDKTPFAIPVREWFEGELRRLVDEVLLSERCLGRGIFDPDHLREGGLGWETSWIALNVELWFRIFVDRERIWVERAQPQGPPGRLGQRESCGWSGRERDGARGAG